MWVEQVVINGFKSYSAEVHVGPFDRNFNAITGLNGTGKSNILDSICFVLGITNLSCVRVSKMDELVYKQGNAGVSSATVSVTFNNDDKTILPANFDPRLKNADKLVVERTIVIGGRNRYKINGYTKTDAEVRSFFQGCQLNVNNPNFLIMQGRITKVINMKPQETLSMLEEAAGTRIFESKKVSSMRALKKKDGKVRRVFSWEMER